MLPFSRRLAEHERVSNVRPPAWGGGGGGRSGDAWNLPPELEGMTELGAVVHVHPSQPGAMTGGIIGTVIGGAMLVLTLGLLVFGPAPAAIGPAMVTVIMLPLGLSTFINLGRAPRIVVTYASGFAAVVGSKRRVWRWEDVTAILTDVRVVSTKRSSYHAYRYVVWNRAGESMQLLSERLEELSALIRTIKDKTFDRMLPDAQKEWDAGTTMKFGDVSASRDAIEAGGQRLAWSAVSNVMVKNGRLIITPNHGRPIKVRVSNIPNVEMLGSLIGVSPVAMDFTYV
jgi:hypothetical protein